MIYCCNDIIVGEKCFIRAEKRSLAPCKHIIRIIIILTIAKNANRNRHLLWVQSKTPYIQNPNIFFMYRCTLY